MPFCQGFDKFWRISDNEAYDYGQGKNKVRGILIVLLLLIKGNNMFKKNKKKKAQQDINAFTDTWGNVIKTQAFNAAQSNPAWVSTGLTTGSTSGGLGGGFHHTTNLPNWSVGSGTFFPNIETAPWKTQDTPQSSIIQQFEYKKTNYEIDLSSILEGTVSVKIAHDLGIFETTRYMLSTGGFSADVGEIKSGLNEKDIEKFILYSHRISREKIDELAEKLTKLQYALDYCKSEHISVALGMGMKEDEI